MKRSGASDETLLRMLDGLVPQLAEQLLAFVFREKSIVLFGAIVRNMMEHRDDWKTLVDRFTQKQIVQLLDDPQPFYPKEVVEVFNRESPDAAADDRAIAALTLMCNQYPVVTKPALLAAGLLSRCSRPTAAIPLLAQAIAQGFSAAGVRECQQLLESIKSTALVKEYLEKKDFAGARKAILARLREQPTSLGLVGSLLAIYAQWSEAGVRDRADIAKALDEDVSAALRADSEAGEQGEEKKTIRNNLLDQKRKLVAKAALGKISTPESAQAALGALQEASKRDPDNRSARAYQAILSHQLGCAQLKANSPEARSTLYAADDLAKLLLALPDLEEDLKSQLLEVQADIAKLVRSGVLAPR
jgi:hypothetical protein